MKNEMDDWLVVSSQCGHHEIGYPIGKILVRNPNDVNRVINDHQIHDPIIRKYKEEVEDGE